MVRDIRKILVIRLSSIGDIVHTLPAVAALGTTFPDAEISWLVEARYASLLEGNPFLKRVLTLDTLGWRKRPFSPQTAREMIGNVQALRAEAFDAAIDFQGLVKTAVIGRLARARRRVGLPSEWLREPAASLLYAEQAPALNAKHVVEQNLALAQWMDARVDAWQFPLPSAAADERWAAETLTQMNAGEFILVSPGAGWIGKRWPPSSYAQLVARLEMEGPWSIILSGSEAEEEDIRMILRESGAQRAYYAPASIRQFIALARRARLFIGGDTGPLHLAAALGVPIVAIYGPTDPIRNGPFAATDITIWNREHVNHTRRAKKPRFLQGISVEDVVAAVRARLARTHEG
ncbi:MAG TPA: lipopolysaccharide heptosyltransferase I [Terriglobia bacterium]|nr:lipopolysaccharide heptosyltransferase I [Terriglobia bacterium]